MPASISTLKWKTTGRLLWRQWGDECAIYNTASGDTHILDLESSQILPILEQQTLDLRDLAEAFAAKCDSESDPALNERIEQLLAKFHDLNLIEPVAQ